MKLLNSILLIALVAMAALANSAPKPVSYKVNTAESKVEWFATKVTGKHNGTVNIQSGSLDFDGTKLTAGKFDIDMTTLTATDLQGEWGTKLVGHLKSDDFFAVEKFKSSSIQIKKASMTAANTYKITADLIIKGITKEIVFDAIINQSAGTATADITLDRTDYDIKYGSGKFFPSIGDKMIHDQFTLKIALAFGKAM